MCPATGPGGVSGGPRAGYDDIFHLSGGRALIRILHIIVDEDLAAMYLTDKKDGVFRQPDDHDDLDADRDVFGAAIPNAAAGVEGSTPPPKLAPKAELTRPLQPHEGVARAIALFDFNAVQVSPLPTCMRASAHQAF